MLISWATIIIRRKDAGVMLYKNMDRLNTILCFLDYIIFKETLYLKIYFITHRIVEIIDNDSYQSAISL